MDPGSFLSSVRGQRRAKDVLARALARERLSQALVLSGPPGVGRTLFARELARALVCAEGTTTAGQLPCGRCAACRKVEKGSHPDVLWVGPDEERASSVIPIESVRAALEELALAPVEARRRVFVIDPADALLEDSMNALLKALEEPPPRAQLILVAAHEGALLDTIGSRCQVVELAPLEPADVRAVLEKALVRPAELERRAAWAGGSPGRGLAPELLQAADAASAVLDALASGAARKDPLSAAERLVEASGGKGAEPRERRARALLVLDLFALGLRDAAVARARATAGAGDRLSGAEPALIARLAQAASSADALARAIDLVDRAAEAVDDNKSTSLVLEGLVIEIAALLDGKRAAAATGQGGAGR